MSAFKLFIVEDDPWYGQILQYHLSLNPDYEVYLFETARDCLSHMHEQPDLITVDFSLPDMSGDRLFKEIRKFNPSIPVVVISSQEDIRVAVSLLKAGVSDYLVKDESTKDLLWNRVIKIRENETLKVELENLKEELGQRFSFEKTIIGQSPVLQKVFRLMEKAVKTTINVSITGETGTGKEVVAKAIHYSGPRKKRNFVAVNMAAIPKDLIESELFGYEKGAFTGAVARKIGKFEQAEGGTIFLDEIAELDLNMQSKLLRVLQERELSRVGGNTMVSLDVRVITATHKNLSDEVREGRFREDLFFRVMGLPIELPPLRERGSDCLILAKHFISDFAKANKLTVATLSQEARNKLINYPFPGNIRELKAVMELAMVMSENGVIQAEDINFFGSQKSELLMSGQKSLRQHIREIVAYYLDKNGGDVLETARILDIGKSTIYKMIKEGEITG